LGVITIENPIRFDIQVDGTYIGVRSLENVLNVGELLDTFHIYLDILQFKAIT
jgi:hypothetical protein